MLLDFLSENLLIEPSFIAMVASSASTRYKKFTIKKRDGSDRIIYQPSRELKAIQRCIHDELFPKLPVHSCVFSYRKGINLKQHVQAHSKSNFVTRLDFTNFFNSINSEDIRLFINDNSKHIDSDWSKGDTELLTKLVCFKGALTIGSVTSPYLSNCICFNLDEEISNYCCSVDVKYTRYADDLYFSTYKANTLFEIPRKIAKIIRSLSYPKNLWINRKKTIHTSKKRQRKITGLVLTNEGDVSIGREKKRRIRSCIYNWMSLSDVERLSLKGYLAFVASIEPTYINNLCNKYGSKLISDIIKFDSPSS